MEFNELMQSFAAKYGLADLKVDNGTAVLEIDGMTVGFIHDPVTDVTFSQTFSPDEIRLTSDQ